MASFFSFRRKRKAQEDLGGDSSRPRLEIEPAHEDSVTRVSSLNSPTGRHMVGNELVDTPNGESEEVTVEAKTKPNREGTVDEDPPAVLSDDGDGSETEGEEQDIHDAEGMPESALPGEKTAVPLRMFNSCMQRPERSVGLLLCTRHRNVANMYTGWAQSGHARLNK